MDAINQINQNLRAEKDGNKLRCENCKSKNAKNLCKKCTNYFCESCELKVNDDSILEFFNSNKVENYICSMVHLDSIADNILFANLSLKASG